MEFYIAISSRGRRNRGRGGGAREGAITPVTQANPTLKIKLFLPSTAKKSLPVFFLDLSKLFIHLTMKFCLLSWSIISVV